MSDANFDLKYENLSRTLIAFLFVLTAAGFVFRDLFIYNLLLFLILKYYILVIFSIKYSSFLYTLASLSRHEVERDYKLEN